MPFSSLRRTVLALAVFAPLSAAHPTETAPSAPDAAEFRDAFDALGQPRAAALPVAGAVDIANIAHTQSGPSESADELARVLGSGSASYYAAKFDGRRTASGEAFDNDDLTAAHRTLPFGSKVRVTNSANGKSVVVRINDRGPFSRGRLIDVSQAAAQRLGLIARGHGKVELALLD